jgi:membrane protease YdiL (CAAX protease family)
VLANFGERNATTRLVSLIAGGVLAGLAAVFGIRFAQNPAQFNTNETTAVAIIVAGALGLAYLLPPVQRAVARIIPLRPGSPVDYLTVVLGLQLIAQQLGAQVTPGKPVTIGDMLAQDIPLLILAFIGVGLFVRRSPREAAKRLGWVAPRDKRWWLVAVVGIIAFLAIAYGIERVADKLSPSTQQQVTNATNVLFSRFNNPFGVILLGLLPGIVEETLFRGALLPRLGIIVTAVLFAALHTQYAITFATLEVFVLGIGLGLLRVRSGSTLPCMVTHAGYNIAVGLIGYLAR